MRDSGFLHQSLRPSRDNGQAFATCERSGGCKISAVIIESTEFEILSGAALLSCIPGQRKVTGGTWQDHARGGFANFKIPAGAGDVPVKLVEIVKETKLASAAVVNLVVIKTARQTDIAVTDIHADAIRLILQVKGLRAIVTLYGQDFESDLVMISLSILITRREVAIDAPFYGLAFGSHPNGFSDQQITVGLNFDIAVIGFDVFGCRSGG